MENRIITELPRRKNAGYYNAIDYKDMIGMKLNIMYEGKNYSIRIIDYISGRSPRLLIDYNGFVLENGISCGSFKKCRFGRILNITQSSKNIFEYSEEYNCWFGWTQKGEKFAFDGDDEIVEFVKSHTWCFNNFGVRGRNKSLHQIVFKGEMREHDVIDHISNELGLEEKWADNRQCNLRIVTKKENTRNKKNTDERLLTGLTKQKRIRSDMYKSAFICQYGFVVATKSKPFKEAYLDNLITQRYLGYKHQEELFYLLDNLDKERILEVEDLIKHKIEKGLESRKDKFGKAYSHKYIVSECDTFIIVSDKNNNQFKISNNEQSKTVLKKFGCRMVCKCNKYYIAYRNNLGDEGNLHRLLLNLTELKYQRWYVDHINGDGTDNRLENLVITDHYGNMCNKKGRGYKRIKSNSFQVRVLRDYPDKSLYGQGSKQISFKTEQEAISEVERRRKYVIENRIQFLNKRQLDMYLEWCKSKKLDEYSLDTWKEYKN